MLFGRRSREEHLARLLCESVAEAEHLALTLADVCAAGVVLRDSSLVAQAGFLEALRSTRRALELIQGASEGGLDVTDDIRVLAGAIGDLVANIEEQVVA